MRKYLALFLILILIFTGSAQAITDCGDADANTWCIETTDNTADGDTVCGGGACTSANTVIILGGTRGNLLLRDFNGSGAYIDIVNEDVNPDDRVIIDGNDGIGYGVLSIYNCKYIDLKGDNDGDLTYGIYVLNDDGTDRSAALRIYGESDHLKLSYMELDGTASATVESNGIHVADGGLSASWTFDTFEIHHNYIHDVNYASMYLGMNDPSDSDNPYTKNFSVHDNIMDDSGQYGMTLKGLATGGSESIYSNSVDTTGTYPRPDIPSDLFRLGISVRTFNDSASVDVYGNIVKSTVGPGIIVGHGGHNIYNNIVCNAGTGNQSSYAHGIETHLSTNGTSIYDNIIIQPTRYGIYNKASATGGVTLSRNLIGDAGSGEWAEVGSGDTIESSGANANTYHADVVDFNFDAWSDDSDYTNDNFIIAHSPQPQGAQPYEEEPQPVSIQITGQTLRMTCKWCEDGVGACDLNRAYNDMANTFANTNVIGLHADPESYSGGTSHKIYSRCKNYYQDDVQETSNVHDFSILGGSEPQYGGEGSILTTGGAGLLEINGSIPNLIIAPPL